MKLVTAEETCQGDFGAPLICDIGSTRTIIGITFHEDMTEFGLPGKPAVHLNVVSLTDWIHHVTDRSCSLF